MTAGVQGHQGKETKALKEKGKAKGSAYKGQGKGAPRDGCFTCGGPHYAAECPQAKGAGAQKSKGKGKGKDGGGKSKGTSKGGKGKAAYYPYDRHQWKDWYPGPDKSTWNSWYPGKAANRWNNFSGKEHANALTFPPLGAVAQHQDLAESGEAWSSDQEEWPEICGSWINVVRTTGKYQSGKEERAASHFGSRRNEKIIADKNKFLALERQDEDEIASEIRECSGSKAQEEVREHTKTSTCMKVVSLYEGSLSVNQKKKVREMQGLQKASRIAAKINAERKAARNS